MLRLLPIAALLLAAVPVEALPELRPAPRQDVEPAVDAVPDTVPAADPAARDRHPTVVKQSYDGLFYVQAVVNGAPVQFVVDPGSSVTILNAQDAARAGVGPTESVRVETAGGASSMQRARIARVVFAGRTLTEVDAAIVKHDLAVSLLGQSALSQLDSVTFRGNRLELN